MAAKRIMVVEDNLTNLQLACDALELHGYEVCRATNAKETLENIASFSPQLILMDIQLPGVDGLRLTQQIKENPDYSSIPIIAITAYAMKGDREKTLSAGCDDYIAKPADIFDVIKLIEKHLQ